QSFTNQYLTPPDTAVEQLRLLGAHGCVSPRAVLSTRLPDAIRASAFWRRNSHKTSWRGAALQYGSSISRQQAAPGNVFTRVLWLQASGCRGRWSHLERTSPRVILPITPFDR